MFCISLVIIKKLSISALFFLCIFAFYQFFLFVSVSISYDLNVNTSAVFFFELIELVFACLLVCFDVQKFNF